MVGGHRSPSARCGFGLLLLEKPCCRAEGLEDGLPVKRVGSSGDTGWLCSALNGTVFTAEWGVGNISLSVCCNWVLGLKQRHDLRNGEQAYC